MSVHIYLAGSPALIVFTSVRSLAGMRVLVIEDEMRMTRLVKRALEEEGHAVDVSGDGPEGNPHAAIVLDVMLPGSDGSSCAGGCGRPVSGCQY